MATLFYWDDDNEDHIAEHGVHPDQAKWVVLHPPRGYAIKIDESKYLVRGQDEHGEYLQVIYVYRHLESIDVTRLEPADRLRLGDDPEIVYVIHARPLNERERRQLRRRRR